MKVLFFGDVVGKFAREKLLKNINLIKNFFCADLTIVNIENSASGRGVTPKIADEFLNNGADVLTSGNHIWDQRIILKYINNQPRLLRPINMIENSPGYGRVELDFNSEKILIINAMTNLFMPSSSSVFDSIENEISKIKLGYDYKAIIIDLHGEATSEKMALAMHFDGKVSMIVGTHTHVPTSDERILEKGTAYQSDAGMCGDYDSVIGMEKKSAIQKFFNKGQKLNVAMGEVTLCGLLVDLDSKTGLAKSISSIRLGGLLKSSHNFDLI